MSTTEVLTGRLTEVATKLEDLQGRYNTSINRLYELGGEIDGMWDGSASDKFAATLGADRDKFNAMVKILISYTDALRQSASIYAKAESDALDVLNAKKS